MQGCARCGEGCWGVKARGGARAQASGSLRAQCAEADHLSARYTALALLSMAAAKRKRGDGSGDAASTRALIAVGCESGGVVVFDSATSAIALRLPPTVRGQHV